MGACPECNGLGYKVKTDIMNATQVKEQCPDCRGSGQKLETTTNGARVGRVACELWKFQDLKDGKIISELMVLICPIIGQTGRPMVRRETGQMLVYGHIPRLGMQTKRGMRRQGHMRHLLELATGDPKMEWMECEWNYSTADGRNCLLGCGFKQNGESLIWTR